MSAPHNDRDRVTEDIAQHLLSRAATLDLDGRQLAELRDAAIEAGISADAFDLAVREWRTSAPVTRSAATWPQRSLRNLGAFAGGAASLIILSAADRLLTMPWLVHKLTDPVGLLLGAALAVRLRARTATVLMGGLAISQGAEFLMDLLAGTPAIHGFYAHLGLMIAGVAGVAVAQYWHRGTNHAIEFTPPSQDGPRASSADDSASRSDGLTRAEADKRFMELLRLRRNSFVTRLQLS